MFSFSSFELKNSINKKQNKEFIKLIFSLISYLVFVFIFSSKAFKIVFLFSSSFILLNISPYSFSNSNFIFIIV